MDDPLDDTKKILYVIEMKRKLWVKVTHRLSTESNIHAIA